MIAAFPGLIGAFFAYRQSTKAAQKSADSKAIEVEAGAYERARTLYENGIRQLEAQLDRMRQQIAEERDISSKLRNQVTELERTVSVLRSQLINSGISLSPTVLPE